ncbi:MAG: mechanosensitive ion channel family protein [Candidatus Dormibacteraeota bacterium]|nr:mechanosensitive ion channel family protein [Candidatus Dormibacteraeota bacterium]
MLADLICDKQFPLDGVCRSIAPHDPTGLAGPLVERLVGPIALFVVLYLLGRLARRLVDRTLRRTTTDRQIRTLVHNVMTVVTYVIAALSALVVAGVNVAVLLTVAGLGTVAIGLALQDILRNILAGIWLLLEHPFRLGDDITVLDQSGVVQNVTLRTTTLRTADGRLSVLPNLTAFSNPVINSTSFNLRQYAVDVRLPQDTDLVTALRAGRRVLEDDEEIARKPPPGVIPQLSGEAVVLHCTFWLDQSSQDPDAITAALAERLWQAALGPQPRPSSGT